MSRLGVPYVVNPSITLLLSPFVSQDLRSHILHLTLASIRKACPWLSRPLVPHKMENVIDAKLHEFSHRKILLLCISTLALYTRAKDSFETWWLASSAAQWREGFENDSAQPRKS